MSKTKIGPNQPCPCGSGRKFKKCCGYGVKKSAVAARYTAAERASALEKLDLFIDERWELEEEDSFEEFWGRYADREDELPETFRVTLRDAQEHWFAFDYRVDDGSRVVEHLLQEPDLRAGERAFLEGLRASSMRLYEVVDTVPGSSMTLRDFVEGAEVRVHERTGSRSIARHECLVARVVPVGCSGFPEMEAGVLHIPEMWRESLVATLKQHRAEFLGATPTAPIREFYKEIVPLFTDAFLSSIFDPIVPDLRNTDDEELVITQTSFHVDDAEGLCRVLDGAEADGVTRQGEGAWGWSGKSAKGQEVSFGTLALGGGVLTVETNSVARGARARDLIERVGGAFVRHRATTHEDLRRKLAEGITARALGRETEADEPDPIDPAAAEAVVLQHYAEHYRRWLDEPVPALGGQTPRVAAKEPALRAGVVELLDGLDRMYERALKGGEPAFDASWMRTELGLTEAGESHYPPPLAHERVAERVPGVADLCLATAERLRALRSGSALTPVLSEEGYGRDLDLQRFVRGEAPSANATGESGATAGPYLRLMVNFELERRKAFWVDSALSYMLEHTEVDVVGEELRVPFPSFAIVFTDRHALSLGERLLSRAEQDPLRGQILRVATVYVTEETGPGGRTLDVVFAFDALGADLPSLVRYAVPTGGEGSVTAFLESVAPRSVVTPEAGDASPARALLRLVINAILYATSAGVTPEVRNAPAKGSPRKVPLSFTPVNSDSVFFLPGTIDITSIRRFQALERVPEGRTMLARFMVRGHWRRPQKGWTDRRLRWIEPYWKGPDMAAVIERVYRLKQ